MKLSIKKQDSVAPLVEEITTLGYDVDKHAVSLIESYTRLQHALAEIHRAVPQAADLLDQTTAVHRLNARLNDYLFILGWTGAKHPVDKSQVVPFGKLVADVAQGILNRHKGI